MNLTELENLLGKDRIKQDPEITKQFCDDWTGRFMGHTKAVISPWSTSEVSKRSIGALKPCQCCFSRREYRNGRGKRADERRVNYLNEKNESS